MDTLRVSSEDFRLNWGEGVHEVMMGVKVIVERYNRPSFVVMNYEQHAAMEKRLHMLEQERRNWVADTNIARMEQAGDYAVVSSPEELEAALNAPAH